MSKLHEAVEAAVRELSFGDHMERFKECILRHVEPAVEEMVRDARNEAEGDAWERGTYD